MDEKTLYIRISSYLFAQELLMCFLFAVIQGENNRSLEYYLLNVHYYHVLIGSTYEEPPDIENWFKLKNDWIEK